MDIEQFKCQDSIETVFDVLGETNAEESSSSAFCYSYDSLNLFGYNGKADFFVRDDENTIRKFECTIPLANMEFEELVSYFSDKYGSYEKSHPFFLPETEQYIWDVTEEELGYSEVCISFHTGNKSNRTYTVRFSDEHSDEDDETYYKYIEQQDGSSESDPEYEIIDESKYNYDENNFYDMSLMKNKDTGNLTLFIHGKYEDDGSGAPFLMVLDLVNFCTPFLENQLDTYILISVADNSYGFIAANGSVVLNTLPEINQDAVFPEKYKDKTKESADIMNDFFVKNGLCKKNIQQFGLRR